MTPIHVYPINDIYPHNTEGGECECKPKVLQNKDGDTIIVHNSWDLREELEHMSAFLKPIGPVQ